MVGDGGGVMLRGGMRMILCKGFFGGEGGAMYAR